MTRATLAMSLFLPDSACTMLAIVMISCGVMPSRFAPATRSFCSAATRNRSTISVRMSCGLLVGEIS